jgi:hypothetical protein
LGLGVAVVVLKDAGTPFRRGIAVAHSSCALASVACDNDSTTADAIPTRTLCRANPMPFHFTVRRRQDAIRRRASGEHQSCHKTALKEAWNVHKTRDAFVGLS